MRIIPVLLTRNLGIGLDDMFQYDMLARSLSAGNGFRWYAPADLAKIAPYLQLDPSEPTDPRGTLTTFRAPLYPGLLSVIYSVFGAGEDRFVPARLAQAALGATLAPMTYFVGLEVLKSGRRPDTAETVQRVARTSALVVAAYPTLVLFPLALATENLFFPLVLASVLVLLRISPVLKPGAQAQAGGVATHVSAILAGVLLGMAALTRSVILPFAALAIAWIVFSLRQRRAALTAALALLITITPWIIRNGFVSGRLTGIETSSGYNLYVGYHPQSTGTFVFGPSLDLLRIRDDGLRDQIGTQQALAFIAADPGRFPYLALRRLGYFFNTEIRAFTYFYVNDFLGPIPPPVLGLILLVLGSPFVVLTLSAAFGVSLLPRGAGTLLLALLLIGYLPPHVFILSEERFHLALLPFISLCAAVLWAKGIGGLKGRPFATFLALTAAGLLLLDWSVQLADAWGTLSQMLMAGGNCLFLPY